MSHFTQDSQAAGPGYAHQVGLPGSGQRTWPRTLELHREGQRGRGSENLATQGAWGKIPGYLSGHKRQIHDVAAGVAAAVAARAPVLLAAAAVVAVAAAGPATRTAIRERAEQRAGALRPRRP